MNISIFGSGYVGLVTGACFAEMGNNVVCVDNDAARSSGLKQGEVPIHEPGLEALVASNLREGRLRFTTSTRGGGGGVRACISSRSARRPTRTARPTCATCSRSRASSAG